MNGFIICTLSQISNQEGWVGHVDLIQEVRYPYKVLVGNLKVTNHFGDGCKVGRITLILILRG
jgi:hypothetical protein